MCACMRDGGVGVRAFVCVCVCYASTCESDGGCMQPALSVVDEYSVTDRETRRLALSQSRGSLRAHERWGTTPAG